MALKTIDLSTGNLKAIKAAVAAVEGGALAALSVSTGELAAGVIAASAAGRALMATAVFDAATVLAKFAESCITNANLIWLIADDAFAAAATSRALFADKFLPAAKANVFVSTEQTGTGSSQDVAHGLTGTPATIIVAPTELAADLTAGYSCVEGTHTGTNVVVTVTNGAKFKVFAWV